MKEWLIQMGKFVLSNWKECLVGSVIVVSVVIFLVGCLKKSCKRLSKPLRKTLLFVTSLALVAPLTLGHMYLKNWGFNHFWVMYAINALTLVASYAGYENLHIREALHWIGRNTVLRLFDAVYKAFHSEKENTNTVLIQSTKQALSEAENLLKQHSYKDDDLKNL